jgi:type III pantothenate kinase
MTILCIDAGNTRIKWGMHDGQSWIASGAVAKGDVLRLLDAWKPFAVPTRIVVSNVAGEIVRSQLTVLLSRWPVAVEWVIARRSQCGVTSGYENPEQLGCDRWAAMIGARHLYGGAALVVMAGSAMTVDALAADGRFLGGLIVPGLNLMAESLSLKTAGVRVDHGALRDFPTNTRDAVWSGAVRASVGAVEQQRAALVAVGEADPVVLLSGGAATEIAPVLSGRCERVENLVLEGLVCIALGNA